MLISIVLTLTSSTDATLPAHLGRANYAATLARLQALDPALGPTIHDGDGPKAITCSDLLGGRAARDHMPIRAGERYYVRLTGLTPPVSQALETALLTDPPTTWLLADQRFAVAGVCCNADDDPWSGRTTYETLAAAQLLQKGRPERKVSLLFQSPTSFQSKGMHIPVPLPNLVFGSLVDRWNTFSPVTLSPEVRQFGEEMVALSNYRLESQVITQKKGTPLIGGVGRATYTALGGDRYWLATMQMLADFAMYSGVGVKTTIGMGQVRRVG
ncbi:MAG: CRISPR system precrRNA processing endoribonuclease RAMP protein Cas6 [Caldilineaceae bacterium]